MRIGLGTDFSPVFKATVKIFRITALVQACSINELEPKLSHPSHFLRIQKEIKSNVDSIRTFMKKANNYLLDVTSMLSDFRAVKPPSLQMSCCYS